jgi:hypothetical protein
MSSPSIIGRTGSTTLVSCDDERKESAKKPNPAATPGTSFGPGLGSKTVPSVLMPQTVQRPRASSSPESPVLPHSAQQTASLRLSFSPTPPIDMLMPERLNQVVKDMSKSISMVGCIDLSSLPPDWKREDHIDKSDDRTPQRTYQERWNDRIIDALSILEDEPEIRSEENKMAMAYFLDDLPVGLITLSQNSAYGDVVQEIIPQVDEFVTHPLTQQAGEILLERVVKMSVLIGGKGRCILYPLNNARGAYRAMGFKNVDHEGFSSMMLLDPADSDSKWVKVGETWKFAKSKNAKYVTAQANVDHAV